MIDKDKLSIIILAVILFSFHGGQLYERLRQEQLKKPEEERYDYYVAKVAMIIVLWFFCFQSGVALLK